MTIIDIPLRWGDMDAYGHITNVQIVRLMEEARVMGLPSPSGTGERDDSRPAPHRNLLGGVAEGVMTLMAEHRVKYRRQVRYRGLPVRVEVGVEQVKGESVQIF